MGHNVWTHIHAVQEANRQYDAGVYPKMMEYSGPNREKFKDIVESIFAAPTRQEADAIVKYYSSYWEEIIGTRGFKGKKTTNARTKFGELFTFVDDDGMSEDETNFNENNLNNLTNELTQ